MEEKICKNHGAHPFEYMKKDSDYRAFFCGGEGGCGQDCEVDIMKWMGNRDVTTLELDRLGFGCWVMVSLGEHIHGRVLAQRSICKKGHKYWGTCERNGCDDFNEGLELFFEDGDGSFFTTSMEYPRIVEVLCPPDCEHRRK